MKAQRLLLFIVLILFSCQLKESKSVEDKNTVKENMTEFLNKIPSAVSPFYFNPNNMDSKYQELIIFPDSIINKMAKDSAISEVDNFPVNKLNIRFERDSKKAALFRVYKKLPINKNIDVLLLAADDWWEIFTFNKEGKQISKIEGIAGLYLTGNSLYTWWFYASDPKAYFSKWDLNDKFQFVRTFEKKELPSPLKSIINEFGEMNH